MLGNNLFPDTAQRFGLDPDVGCKVLYRNMLNEIRIFAQKFQVSLIGREGEQVGSSLLHSCDNLFIDILTERTPERAFLCEQLLVGLCQPQHFAG